MKLSLKVITIFFISVLTALAVMAVIGINLSIRQSTKNLKETANIALTTLSSTLSEDIGTAFAQIEEIATHDTVTTLLQTPVTGSDRRKALEQGVQALLSDYKQFNKNYLYVYLGARDGSLIVDRDIRLPEGYTPVTRPWYIEALRCPGQPLINDIYLSVPGGYPMASISRSVLSRSGTVLGVVSIDFLFSRYQKIMQSLAFQSGFIVITHNNTSVIAHSKDPDAGFTRLTTLKNTDLSRANGAINGEIVTIHGQEYTAYIKDIQRYKLKILTFISESTLHKARMSYILLYAFTAAVILLIVGITGSHLARNTLLVEQASIKAKHDFFKNMNHEIRTPLNAVMGFIELLSDTPLNKKQTTYIGHTKSAAKHLSRIVNDVLDISSMNAGKYRIIKHDYILHDLIGHIVALVEQTVGKKPIRLHISASSEIPHALRGDSMRLKQVLLNILHNAVKFTDSGIISLRIGCQRIGCQAEGEKICLAFTITDTGTGIAPEHLPHVFEEFTQFSTHQVQGTGLGLALTRHLVERMGGGITCTSTPGKGTRFDFHVFQEPVDPQRSLATLKPLPTPGTPSLGFSAPEASVLLVEDDPLSRTMITELLSRHRITVHTAKTGSAFLQAMDSDQPFDLVLTDIKLPGINGYTATKQLRALMPPRPLPPIIAFSAGDTMNPMKPGPFDACIQKPIDLALFQKTLLTWLPENKIQRKTTPSPVLDASGGEHKYGRDLYLKLLWVFRENHGNGVNIMEGMAKEGKFSELEVRVHRFKGALMNIGAHETAGIAAAIEHRLEAGDPIKKEELHPLRQAADRVMEKVNAQIREMEGRDEGTDKTELKNWP
ncbi:ATP-binding protein [Desulfoluna sp.]|uniref:ATP-binding protein n=1 Tax=Desulfoluna sp. TaxID=2045199 RepID=UPI0026252A49|nr:ATP-binding protein [Desulfoluna sp.]